MDPFLRLGVQGSPQVPDEDEPCDDEAFFIPSGIISSMDEEEDELERLPQHNIFSTWHHASAFAPTPSTYLTGWSPLGWQQQQQQQQPQQPPLAATKSQPSLPSVKQQPQRGERVSASSGAVSSSGLASQHSLPAIQSAPATTAPARKQPNPPLSTRRATVQPTANPLDSAAQAAENKKLTQFLRDSLGILNQSPASATAAAAAATSIAGTPAVAAAALGPSRSLFSTDSPPRKADPFPPGTYDRIPARTAATPQQPRESVAPPSPITLPIVAADLPTSRASFSALESGSDSSTAAATSKNVVLDTLVPTRTNSFRHTAPAPVLAVADTNSFFWQPEEYGPDDPLEAEPTFDSPPRSPEPLVCLDDYDEPLPSPQLEAALEPMPAPAKRQPLASSNARATPTSVQPVATVSAPAIAMPPNPVSPRSPKSPKSPKSPGKGFSASAPTTPTAPQVRVPLHKSDSVLVKMSNQTVKESDGASKKDQASPAKIKSKIVRQCEPSRFKKAWVVKSARSSTDLTGVLADQPKPLRASDPVPLASQAEDGPRAAATASSDDVPSAAASAAGETSPRLSEELVEVRDKPTHRHTLDDGLRVVILAREAANKASQADASNATLDDAPNEARTNAPLAENSPLEPSPPSASIASHVPKKPVEAAPVVTAVPEPAPAVAAPPTPAPAPAPKVPAPAAPSVSVPPPSAAPSNNNKQAPAKKSNKNQSKPPIKVEPPTTSAPPTQLASAATPAPVPTNPTPIVATVAAAPVPVRSETSRSLGKPEATGGLPVQANTSRLTPDKISPMTTLEMASISLKKPSTRSPSARAKRQHEAEESESQSQPQPQPESEPAQATPPEPTPTIVAPVPQRPKRPSKPKKLSPAEVIAKVAAESSQTLQPTSLRQAGPINLAQLSPRRGSPSEEDRPEDEPASSAALEKFAADSAAITATAASTTGAVAESFAEPSAETASSEVAVSPAKSPREPVVVEVSVTPTVIELTGASEPSEPGVQSTSPLLPESSSVAATKSELLVDTALKSPRSASLRTDAKPRVIDVSNIESRSSQAAKRNNKQQPQLGAAVALFDTQAVIETGLALPVAEPSMAELLSVKDNKLPPMLPTKQLPSVPSPQPAPQPAPAAAPVEPAPVTPFSLQNSLQSSWAFILGLHQSAFAAISVGQVWITIFFIYWFPYIIQLMSLTTSLSPSVLWYTFLGWFFMNGTPMSLRLLLPLLFVFEAVCNPRFILAWNGGERLVLAFVLLAMRSNGFFRRNLLYLGGLILCSVAFGSNALVQWVILVLALNSLGKDYSPATTATAPAAAPVATAKSTAQPPQQRDDEADGMTASYFWSGTEFEFPLLLPSFEANLLPPPGQVGLFSKKRAPSKSTARRRGPPSRW